MNLLVSNIDHSDMIAFSMDKLEILLFDSMDFNFHHRQHTHTSTFIKIFAQTTRTNRTRVFSQPFYLISLFHLFLILKFQKNHSPLFFSPSVRFVRRQKQQQQRVFFAFIQNIYLIMIIINFHHHHHHRCRSRSCCLFVCLFISVLFFINKFVISKLFRININFFFVVGCCCLSLIDSI